MAAPFLKVKKTAVVILNWNGAELLSQFLPGVEQHSLGAAIYVVDNASTDKSVAYVRSKHPQVHLIVLDRNYGFAEGYNRGLASIEADIYVLLNSDVEVTPGWLEPVLSIFETNQNVAACQPKILDWKNKSQFEHAGAAGGYVDKNGFMFCAGRIFNSFEEDHGQYDSDREVFWASGACLFVRADLYEAAGGLDPDFFAHMEEIDLCWRLKNMGYTIWAAGQSKVYHIGGASLHMQHPYKVFLNFRNNLFLLTKNYNYSPLLPRLLTRMILDGVAAFKFLTEGKPRFFLAVFKAHFHFYLALRGMLRKRKARTLRKPNKVGLYSGSIVADFFLRGKKSFHDLDPQKFEY